MLEKIKPLYLIWRILSLSVCLLWLLLFSVKSDPQVTCILVQNPPAIPLLFIALLYTRIKAITQQQRPDFVIDWHNLGYSMLNGRTFRKIAEAFEFEIAPLADGHLTVTAAMKDFLMDRKVVKQDNIISVLYDCPPAMFAPLQLIQQHETLQKLHNALSQSIPKSWNLHSLDTSKETILTSKLHNGNFEPRKGRPAFVTSSTSWTPDEDFGVLLDALVTLDTTIQENESTLKVLVAVTGKGPLKSYYEEKMSKLKLTSVAIQTVWLEPNDYPRLLACADLGISLHTSTSGLDLPMKILDLAGCQVPVCALDFACLSELVQDKHNGRTFKNASELSDQLWSLLSPLAEMTNASSHAYGDLAGYSDNLKGRTRWQENWSRNALPVLMKQGSSS
eukprot:Sro1157_g247400.2  (391) ;mRNA; r:22333-23505